MTDKDKLAKVAALEPLATEMGASLAQFALAWCLQNPYVSTVITGASRVEQVHENMKALEFVDKFTPEIMAQIDQIFGIEKEEDEE
jgi:aryl-alcohol dehydrogenase-like predicted oxidoreductase